MVSYEVLTYLYWHAHWSFFELLKILPHWVSRMSYNSTLRTFQAVATSISFLTIVNIHQYTRDNESVAECAHCE